MDTEISNNHKDKKLEDNGSTSSGYRSSKLPAKFYLFSKPLLRIQTLGFQSWFALLLHFKETNTAEKIIYSFYNLG